jgi:hypothetical protein
MAVKVHEGREVLQLLAHNKAQGSQHSNPAMSDLGLAPTANVLDAGSAGQVQGVKHVREGRADAGKGLQVYA